MIVGFGNDKRGTSRGAENLVSPRRYASFGMLNLAMTFLFLFFKYDSVVIDRS